MTLSTFQATEQATTTNQPITKPSTATVPGQPWRPLSTVERDLAPWLKDILYNKRSHSNGTFSGRGAK